MPSEEHSIRPLSTRISAQSSEINGTNGNEQVNPLKRGKWKKIRVSPVGGNDESFESAESQNLGPQLLNSLQRDTIKSQSTAIPNTEATPMFAMTTTMSPPITMSAKLLNENIPKVNLITTTSSVQLSAVENIKEEAEEDVAENPTMTTMTVQKKDAFVNSEGDSSRQLSLEDPDNEKDEIMETTTYKESATRRMDEMDMEEDDLDSQPSLFSEVKKQLHELFSIEDTDDAGVTAALTAVGKRRQDYTNIVRHKYESANVKKDSMANTVVPPSTVSPSFDEPMSDAEKKAFHKQLMEHVVYATSQPEVDETSETEICYRGRCIKSEDLPSNHKLN